MDRVDSEIEGKNIIFFDGVCNLCNKGINFLMQKDKKGHFHYASLQSSIFQKVDEKHNLKGIDSVVLLKEKKVYTQSDAILEIAKTLGGFYSFLTIFKIIPKFIRDNIYALIARKRYSWFGKKNTCRIPTAEEKAFFLE